ncbi:myosin light chain kinase 2, skeletal/cardiac muscle isoform X1 [Gadus morhua]|uniref:myosin light chain kinase 2, skeletal/cardiac muscle isoform X1 n=1 Tax=Gadus morhua TaxID=8049 RepID=UPI0011B4F832|nr:myosin light chain kinase 2, skeletal/cardiac muscle-like isoform X1 [Gadus morhua]
MSSKLLSHPSKAGATVGDSNGPGNGMDIIQSRIELLSTKMDRLIHIQEKVLSRLDGMSQDIDGIERDVENMKVDKEEIHVPPPKTVKAGPTGEVREMCQEMSSIMTVVNQRSEQQAQKLEGMEKLVLGIQQVISFIGETVKGSQIMERMFKGPAARKSAKAKDNKGRIAVKRPTSTDAVSKKADKTTSTRGTTKGTQTVASACEPCTPLPSHKTKLHGPKQILSPRKYGIFLKDPKGKEAKEKPCLSLKSKNTQKKKKNLDTTADTLSQRKHALLLEEVQKINEENTEKSGLKGTEATDSSGEPPQASSTPVDVPADRKGLGEDRSEEDSEKEKEEEEDGETASKEPEGKSDEDKPEEGHSMDKVDEEEATTSPSVQDLLKDAVPASRDDPQETEKPQMPEITPTPSSKHHVTYEEQKAGDHTKSQVEVLAEVKEEEEEEEEEQEDPEGWAVFKADGVEIHMDLLKKLQKKRDEVQDEEPEEDDDVERHFIDNSPPPGAPFNHRIVSAKPSQIRNFYSINHQEILGGGRFGQVHKCVENSSGLTLAAKVIKARSVKEKEVVKNEIQVMNQLDHANLIQLYAAYESRNDMILVLEFVDGGELFDRIIDVNYTLMELETVSFIRQICEGLQHMHKMYILHLDLKPENILCVSRVTNKVKIIDFGLARIYKPREKLRVNFGTPEFLAPEVINYDFVSFNTDMWSLGVITYMLLSGLCPFLGDDDNQTLNNILAAKWNFEEEEFITVSAEAKDFITRLLVVNKTWRMGATEALKHPWLSDPVLHHRLYTRKTMCKSRRSSCIPP